MATHDNGIGEDMPFSHTVPIAAEVVNAAVRAVVVRAVVVVVRAEEAAAVSQVLALRSVTT